MVGPRKLTAADVALTTVFTAYYAIFGFLKISPIIGLPGQAITAAAFIAPILGILLGPYIGTLSAFLGGTIGFFLGSLSYQSLASGTAAAFCAGTIRTGKRAIAALVYLLLLLLFAFYPAVGPAWIFPLETWFQVVGLLILISPLQSAAQRRLDSDNNKKLLFGFFPTCLASTLAGQIAGSIVFEMLATDPKVVIGSWLTLTALYPIERTIIALAATFIGAPLSKILKSANLTPHPPNQKHSVPAQFQHKTRRFNMKPAQFNMQTCKTAYQTPPKDPHKHSPRYLANKKPIANRCFWLKNTQKPC
jgi:hypothetical protein